MTDSDPRSCAFGCGLAAEPGDVYCTSCRSGYKRLAEVDRKGRRDRERA